MLAAQILQAIAPAAIPEMRAIQHDAVVSTVLAATIGVRCGTCFRVLRAHLVPLPLTAVRSAAAARRLEWPASASCPGYDSASPLLRCSASA